MNAQAPKEEMDLRLTDALRASGITQDDARSVEMLYAVAGQQGSHRIVSAMRAIGVWLRAKGGQP